MPTRTASPPASVTRQQSPTNKPLNLDVFPSSLGWIAIIGSADTLFYLTFGHVSEDSAAALLYPELTGTVRPGRWNQSLVCRLQAYAGGVRDDFRDIQVNIGNQTPFRRMVLDCCRKIPFGETLTYGQLASATGSPRAARAVGRCMATNRIPLVIPCHRVVAADGGLGGFSAPGGIKLKRHLLDLETGRASATWTDSCQ